VLRGRRLGRTIRCGLVGAAAAGFLVFAGPALADSWLPHAADATWTYQWVDSAYNPAQTNEKVTVKSTKGDTFTLAWTTDGQGNADDAPSSAGTVSFQDTDSGLVNTDWSSNPPPANFPILCAAVAQCGNSLASTYYNVIWGSRVPLLAEPLLQGASWASTGGTQNDVASANRYLGQEKVTVPAFPQGVVAAKVQSQVTQAGALGDPYGSGVRTTWWVYGVGPVKVLFEHTGGPVTTAVLTSTNQTALPTPSDQDYFPLVKGKAATYRWTNTKWLKQPSVQKVTVSAVANESAQLSLASVSGPIKVAGAYGYTSRVSGVTNIWGTTKAASLVKLPALGPKSLPAAQRRHFFTPLDLMDWGYNPILSSYPKAGQTWTAKSFGRDWEVFGVTGTSTVLGVQKVKVPAGMFQAVAVKSTFVQPGFKAGSGTRTSWFAPGRGLVKLVFRHGDGSVSEVDLIK
jgi:hypothetical protein